jgi:hypothetical protein
MKRKITIPASGEALKKQLIEQYKLASAASLALVDTAAHALDLAMAAEAAIARDGIVLGGQRGLRAHPACTVARDARSRLISALRALNVEFA